MQKAESRMKPEAAEHRSYYDVFGITMRVERRKGQWRLYSVLTEGKSSPVLDVSIPDGLREDELARFLDDMFHEFTSPAYDKVRKLR